MFMNLKTATLRPSRICPSASPTCKNSEKMYIANEAMTAHAELHLTSKADYFSLEQAKRRTQVHLVSGEDML